jgi:hypothetical protein
MLLLSERALDFASAERTRGDPARVAVVRIRRAYAEFVYIVAASLTTAAHQLPTRSERRRRQVPFMRHFYTYRMKRSRFICRPSVMRARSVAEQRLSCAYRSSAEACSFARKAAVHAYACRSSVQISIEQLKVLAFG